MGSAVELLNQGVGYGVMVGVGFFFAFFIFLLTWLSHRYLNENEESTETFMVANRSVGVGLTGSAVLSSWMWATVLIWSAQMVYSYGIAAAYLYAASSSVQIAVLAVIAAETKKKIPNAHTSLEIIKLRYGTKAHLLYIFLGLVDNLLSCASMILGASQVFMALCNMHPVAANLLLPFTVILYTVVAGLKATFLTDYLHTFIALIIFMYFATAGVSNNNVNGIGDLYDQVIAFQAEHSYYVDGNYKGSLLTMKSPGSWYFGLIHSIGDFGLSVMDSSFWQKAFSSDVTATLPGYVIGSLCIYCLSFPIGTIWGLLNVILEHTPEFPLYPNSMTADDINNAYGILYTLYAVLGKGAVGAALLSVYLSCTSTVSAETISVSSIISFDIYRAYINPDAKNKSLIRMSHFGVVFFGLFAAGFSIMLHYVGCSITWMGYFYSMLICPGVIPLLASITWDRQTEAAAIISPIIGIGAGLGVWLGTAKSMYGAVNVTTTMQQLPSLYGSLTAIFLPGILTVIISLTYKPHKFDWSVLQEAKLVEDDDTSDEEVKDGDSVAESEEIVSNDDEIAHEVSSNDNELRDRKTHNTDEKDVNEEETSAVPTSDDNLEQQADTTVYRNGLTREEYNKKADRYIKWAWIYAGVNILVTNVLWPLPLYRDYIFNKAFFKGWVTFAIMTVYFSFLAVGIFPLWDGRHTIIKVLKGIHNDLFKRKRK